MFRPVQIPNCPGSTLSAECSARSACGNSRDAMVRANIGNIRGCWAGSALSALAMAAELTGGGFDRRYGLELRADFDPALRLPGNAVSVGMTVGLRAGYR